MHIGDRELASKLGSGHALRIPPAINFREISQPA
jgi:hypothetical protein